MAIIFVYDDDFGLETTMEMPLADVDDFAAQLPEGWAVEVEEYGEGEEPAWMQEWRDHNHIARLQEGESDDR